MSDCKFVSFHFLSLLAPNIDIETLFKPWVLSNIIDSRTGKVPEGVQPFCIFERGGVNIGVIGVVEE